MEIGGNTQNNDIQKKGGRRTWTKVEEEALLTVLEDIVARGNRCDNGCFKAGTSTMIEKQLNNLCPNSGLKATPHIESKMKIWKKQYGIIFDMLNKSGFGWDDVLKCIQVDSDEVWQAYVQSHKEAEGWRGKHFPLYDRFAVIFGADRATGKGVETPADMAENVNNEEALNEDDFVMQQESSYSPMSMNQTSTTTQSHHNQKKRGRSSGDIGMGLEKLAKSFDKMFEKSREDTQMLVEAIKRKDDSLQHEFVWGEITKLNLSVADQIKAMKLFAEQLWNVSALKSMDEARRLEYVMTLIGQGSSNA